MTYMVDYWNIFNVKNYLLSVGSYKVMFSVMLKMLMLKIFVNTFGYIIFFDISNLHVSNATAYRTHAFKGYRIRLIYLIMFPL